MTTANVSDFLRRLTRGMVAETLADQSDRQLVEQFLAGRGDAVFEAIVRRHGAMVYRVCWRVLQHHQDAEDAFQATFLVLAQRLRTVRKRASLSSWLHGVAHRVALKARKEAATRRRHEAQASVCQTVPPDDISWGEVRAVLDAELAGLAEKWRLPLVLCYLEGRTQDEAAAQLGWSTRTLRRRLEEGRTGLGRRLGRRGVVWPAALSAVLFSESVASAALSPGLVDSTVQAASLFAAGQAAAVGLISANVAALMKGVVKGMLLTKLKIAVIVFLVVATLGTGVSALTRETMAADPAPAAAKSARPTQDEGNLKETVLALEKRIWEALTKQDVDAFKNLVADDFVGIDANGHPYDKPGTLGFVARFRVLEYTMRDVKVIVLSATSAILSYEVGCKIRPTDGQNIESTTRRVTSAWTQRKGRWWYIYGQDMVVQKDGDFRKVFGFDTETGEQLNIKFKPDGLSETLKKLNSEKKPPND